MQNNRWLQALIILLVIISSMWLAAQVWGTIIQFSSILLLFFVSWLLSFILRPIARWLTTRGLPYGASVAIVYLALAVAVTISGFLLVPLIIQQITQLTSNPAGLTKSLSQIAEDIQVTLKGWGIGSNDLQNIINNVFTQFQGAILTILQNTLPFLQGIAAFVLQLVFIVLISFYFMKDGDRLSAGILRVLPTRWQDEVRLASMSIERSFGGFLRGQVVFALLYGIVTAVIMMIPPFQLDYVVIASIAAGLCMILPLVGGFIAYIPPVLVALITPDKPWWVLLVILFVIQSIMINVLGPRIMSSAIGLHPIYVVAALLVGGQIAGIWGALFGVPIAGAINLIGRPLLRRIRSQSSLYAEPQSHDLPTSAFITGPLAASMASTMTLPDLPRPNAEPVRPPMSAPPTATPPATASATTSTPPRMSEKPPSLVMSPADYFAELEQDAEDNVRHSPTLSARALSLVIMAGSRATSWAWSKVRKNGKKRA
ncbi:MAG: AI-2E family transporter [Chloroflexia bacterium]